MIRTLKEFSSYEKPTYRYDKLHYLLILLIVVGILFSLLIVCISVFSNEYPLLEEGLVSFFVNVLDPLAIIFCLIFFILLGFNLADDSWKHSLPVNLLMFTCLSLVMALSAVLGGSTHYIDFALALLAMYLGLFIGGKKFGILLMCEIPLMFIVAHTFFGKTFDIITIPTLTAHLLIGIIWCYLLKDGYDYVLGKRSARYASIVLIIHSVIAVFVFGITGNLEWLELTLVFAVTIAIIYLTLSLFHFCNVIISREISSKHFSHDLAIASDIQMSCVPDERIISERICISGMMRPALEVGGDYFDYKKIQDGLYLMVIGDVSDKRLPAALFMLKAKGIIDTAARMSYDPGEILTLVNKELCYKNSADLFMTCWLGIVDTDLGILEYANAGHKVPYLLGEDGISRIQMKPEPALGIYDSIEYTTQRVELNDTDGIFTYTDGVTECLNINDEMFGASNLEKGLGECMKMDPYETITHIYDAVGAFSGTVGASDDIAMVCMALDRTGYSSVTVQANKDRFGEVSDFINGLMHDKGASDSLVNKMDVIAEELFLNICYYSQMGDDGAVRIICYYEDGLFQFTFCDTGVPFDPTNTVSPQLNISVPDRFIGGLGIHMVRKLSDGFYYRHCHGMNITTVLKRISGMDQQ